MSYEHIHRKMGSAVMLQVYPLQQNLLITAITQIPELNPKQSIISAGGRGFLSGVESSRRELVPRCGGPHRKVDHK